MFPFRIFNEFIYIFLSSSSSSSLFEWNYIFIWAFCSHCTVILHHIDGNDFRYLFKRKLHFVVVIFIISSVSIGFVLGNFLSSSSSFRFFDDFTILLLNKRDLKSISYPCYVILNEKWKKNSIWNSFYYWFDFFSLFSCCFKFPSFYFPQTLDSDDV